MNTLIPLNNGLKIPALGLGTGIGSKEEQVLAIKEALDLGYRHFDTAWLYKSEEMVGTAINESEIPRKDIFVTTKLYCYDHDPLDVQPAFERSLKALNLEYVDLYLMHWPIAFKKPEQEPPIIDEKIDYLETWRAMEQLHLNNPNKVKSIGVSNFTIKKLDRLLKNCKIKPVVNQVELHPYLSQEELLEYCIKHDILLVAYSPVGRGDRSDLSRNKTLTQIAKKHNKQVHQIILSWHIKRGCGAIPRSLNKSHIKSNSDICELDEDDMKVIKTLNKGLRLIPSIAGFDAFND